MSTSGVRRGNTFAMVYPGFDPDRPLELVAKYFLRCKKVISFLGLPDPFTANHCSRRNYVQYFRWMADERIPLQHDQVGMVSHGDFSKPILGVGSIRASKCKSLQGFQQVQFLLGIPAQR